MNHDDYEKSETPMHSRDAEMAVLGAMILSPVALRQVCRILTKNDFVQSGHQLIFEALVSLESETIEAVDLVILEAKLGPKLADCGGANYLIELSLYVPSAANSGHYAGIVKSKSELRALGKLARDIAHGATHGMAPSEIRLQMARHLSGTSPMIDFEPAASIDRRGDDRGISTGFPQVDAVIAVGGWPTGQLSVVAAQEKAGKSSLLIGSCAASCSAGLRVCYATFADLNRRRILWRLLRHQSGYSNAESAMRHGGEYGREAFERAEYDLNSVWDLDIYDGSKSSLHRDIDRFLGALESHQEGKRPYGVVYIDYAQKLTSSQANASNQVALGDYCSDTISAAAERLGIPIVVGSQITAGSLKLGTEAITKGSRKWLEDCGLCLMIECEQVNERRIGIYRSRFGGMGAVLPYRWDDHYLKFVAV